MSWEVKFSLGSCSGKRGARYRRKSPNEFRVDFKEETGDGGLIGSGRADSGGCKRRGSVAGGSGNISR
jgi:hypothetical protein